MKKVIFFSIVLILTIGINTIAFSADKIFSVPDEISVNDFSKVMSDNTKTFMINSNEKLYDSTGSKVVFVTVPTTDREPVDQYARRLYDAWGMSSVGGNTSTFVLLATDDMEYWVIVGDNLSSALTKEYIEKILLAYMEPDFAKGNFDAAIKNTYIAISEWYTGHYNSDLDITPDNPAEKPEEKSNNTGAIWLSLKILLAVVLVGGAVYLIVRRRIRLYAVEQRKRQRIQSYRKYSHRTPGSGDYEYFEFYDTKD